MVLSVQSTETIQSVLHQLLQMEDGLSATFQEGEKAYTVLPATLQTMMQMGLGEIPVDAIGVPSDSPLLSMGLGQYSENGLIQNQQDISRHLTRYFPGNMVAALYELQSLFKRANLKGYVIGGNIRDLLRCQSRILDIEDVDVTVEGDAISASQFIVANSRNFQVSACFPEFGTTKLVYKESIHFDLASTRREVYAYCGALPAVLERGVPLDQDIVRRDFTINALALSVHDLGQILDYSHGIQDIENRLIRVLHPASFFEDPSRILRAFKFLARLDFNWTESTERLVRKFLQYGAVAYPGGGERIKHELIRFLIVNESVAKHYWLDQFVCMDGIRLANMQLSTEARPAEEIREQQELLKAVGDYQQSFHEGLGPVSQEKNFLWQLYLCFLLEDLEAESLMETSARLGLKRQEREVIEKFNVLLKNECLACISEEANPVTIYEVFDHQPLASIAAGALKQYRESPKQLVQLLQAVRRFKDKLENIRPELNGNDLIELGVKPGETVGQMLRSILEAKLNGRLPDRLSEIRFVQKQLGVTVPALKVEKPTIQGLLPRPLLNNEWNREINGGGDDDDASG